MVTDNSGREKSGSNSGRELKIVWKSFCESMVGMSLMDLDSLVGEAEDS